MLTSVIRITVFVKKREKLILPIILYIYAVVDSCSATFYYLKKYITGPKLAQCTLKWTAAVSCGIPKIFHGEPWNLAKGLPRKTVGPKYDYAQHTISLL